MEEPLALPPDGAAPSGVPVTQDSRPFKKFAGMLATLIVIATGPTVRAGGEQAGLLTRLRGDLRAAGLALEASHYPIAAERFLAVIEQAHTIPEPNLALARAVDGLADVRRLEGRLEDAARLYGESSGMWTDLLGEDQPRRATTLHNLGAVLVELGRPAEAVPHLKRALSIWELSFGSDSREARNTRALHERASRSR